jgi:hypothetical protein
MTSLEQNHGEQVQRDRFVQRGAVSAGAGFRRGRTMCRTSGFFGAAKMPFSCVLVNRSYNDFMKLGSGRSAKGEHL